MKVGHQQGFLSVAAVGRNEPSLLQTAVGTANHSAAQHYDWLKEPVAENRLAPFDYTCGPKLPLLLRPPHEVTLS
jgi:hypothetical protein